MFGMRAFRTGVRVVVGACLFSILFMVVGVMAESVIAEQTRVTPAALGLSVAAFFGYVTVAWILRQLEAGAE